MIGGLGMTELIVIFGIALLVFGAAKIPEIARSLGQGIQEFRRAGKAITDETGGSTKEKPEDKTT